jgi:hypothetical protein
MSCSRSTCNNIMCDTYIGDVGYVCWECQKEFEEYLQRNNYNPTTAHGIVSHLKMFMKTDKSAYDNENELSVGEFFRNNTRER